MTNQNWNDQQQNPETGQDQNLGQDSVGSEAGQQSTDAGQQSWNSGQQDSTAAQGWTPPQQSDQGYNPPQSSDQGYNPPQQSQPQGQSSAPSWDSGQSSYGAQSDQQASSQSSAPSWDPGQQQQQPPAYGQTSAPSWDATQQQPAGQTSAPSWDSGQQQQQPPAYGQPTSQTSAPSWDSGQQQQQPPAYGQPTSQTSAPGGWEANQQQNGYNQYGAPGATAGYNAPGAYGGQQPAYGDQWGGGQQLADWGKRAVGFLVDYVGPYLVYYVLVLIVTAMFPVSFNPDTGAYNASPIPTIVNLVLGLAFLAYFVWSRYIKGGSTGVSLGRSMAKTKLISEATGQPLGGGMTFVRDLAHVVDSVICLVGWLFPLWDQKKQTLADKMMKTVVVMDPNAGAPAQQQQPYGQQPYGQSGPGQPGQMY